MSSHEPARGLDTPAEKWLILSHSDQETTMGELIIRHGLFERKRRLNPILPRLLSIVLREAHLSESIYPELEHDLAAALCHPRFPDMLLDEERFVQLERKALEMDTWSEDKRVEAWFSAFYHMRACLEFDFFALPSLRRYLADADQRAHLTVAMGIMAIAWQIKNHQELVLSLADFNRAHPDIAAKWRRPR